MQKVVGSNPISRFAGGPCLQVFRGLAVGWTFCGGWQSIGSECFALVVANDEVARCRVISVGPNS